MDFVECQPVRASLKDEHSFFLWGFLIRFECLHRAGDRYFSIAQQGNRRTIASSGSLFGTAETAEEPAPAAAQNGSEPAAAGRSPRPAQPVRTAHARFPHLLGCRHQRVQTVDPEAAGQPHLAFELPSIADAIRRAGRIGERQAIVFAQLEGACGPPRRRSTLQVFGRRADDHGDLTEFARDELRIRPTRNAVPPHAERVY